ncbi:MAG: RsiV family protein [Prevotellaceae bacterium]|jgi:hypothetical protein|nr:RsiV family protein [Prevotellaceae bacterium]
MRKVFILLSIVVVSSCFSKTGTFDAVVNFEKVKVEKKSGDLSADSTYEVSVVYYNPVDAPEYLKDSILKHTKLLLASWFDVKGQFDLNTSVQKHFDEYFRQVERNNLPSHTAFHLRISPDDVYQNEHVISFVFNWMIYEGGAHPNSGKFCFVIDKKSGSKVSYKSLTAEHETEFLNIAEAEFKAQSGIKTDEKIYDLYWFKDGKFHLTDNFAFTPAGLVFTYNPYEIAPYSFGLIELTLPYEKIAGMIKKD